MGRAFEAITPQMHEFIERQHIFFVATATTAGGHVNLSPKGYDSFRILDPNRVAYIDFTGSGAETIAHARDNGRITFMFCAFDGNPDIIRLYGTATVLRPDEKEFSQFRGLFETDGSVRSIIIADIDRTSNACGYAVPLMDFVEDRSRLTEWGQDKSDQQIRDYWAQKNATSIDGLPAV